MLATLVVLGFVVNASEPEQASTAPYTVEALRELLSANPDGPLIPELASFDAAALLGTDFGKEVLDWANTGNAEPIPVTAYTDYRSFRRDGSRGPYEGPYFGKRSLLTQAAILAWLDDDAAQINRLNDLIWNVCEETTWVLPAHEKDPAWTIDLFAAETASELAHIILLLGDRIPDEVRARALTEIHRRVLDPYLEHAPEYWWASGRNNWTGVCAGSIGETSLLVETDPDRQAQTLAFVLEHFARFIDVGFEDDGGCLEGIGYWNYGLLHYVSLAEMLRERTGGAIDLLAEDKFKAIATYPDAVALGRHIFAAFADAHEESSIQPFLGVRIAERTGRTSLVSQLGEWPSWRVMSVLRNILWWDGTQVAEPLIEDAFLPVSGIGKCVAVLPGGRRTVLCAKAGHNAEPHNNNDVGSFVLRVGESTFLCDPGGGKYTRQYFGPERYENVFANSYGHSVPRIGGQLQPAGAEYRGAMTMPDGKTIRIQMERAYAIPELKGLTRTFRLLDDASVELEDHFVFEGAGLDIQEALITWLDVRIEDGKACLPSPEGELEIRCEGATLAAERLEEACAANSKSGVLTRITATFPAAPETVARFSMRFLPSKPE